MQPFLDSKHHRLPLLFESPVRAGEALAGPVAIIEPTRQISLVRAVVGELRQPSIAPGSGSFWVIGTRHQGPEQGPWRRR